MTQDTLFSLAGRVACVTGASSGLGQAAATILARAGAQVVGVARRQAELDAWSAAAPGAACLCAVPGTLVVWCVSPPVSRQAGVCARDAKLVRAVCV